MLRVLSVISKIGHTRRQLVVVPSFYNAACARMHSSPAGGIGLLPTTGEEIDRWAQNNNLSRKTAETLKKHELSGHLLLKLTEQRVEKLGLPLGAQIALLDAVAALRVEDPLILRSYRRKGDGPVVTTVRSERHFDLMLGGGRDFVAIDKKGIREGVTCWEDAVAAYRQGKTLQVMSSTAELTDDASTPKGADANRATGFELQSTSAIAQDPTLKQYRPLEALNDGRGVTFKRNNEAVLEVDGILRNTSVLVAIAVKASARVIDVEGGLADDGKEVKGLRQRVESIKECIADPEVTTDPPEVMAQLREFCGKDIIPVLSTYNPTPGALEACRKQNIFCLTHKGPGGTLTL